MRPSLLCAILLFAFVSPFARAQSSGGDGSEAFVDAYEIAQQGEKAEQAGNLKAALQKLREAAKALDKISREYPSWSREIVKYRKDRTAEAIVRVQERLARVGGKGADTTAPEPSPEPEPSLPDGKYRFQEIPGEKTAPDSQNSDLIPPPIVPEPPRGRGKHRDDSLEDDIGKFNRRVKDLQSKLEEAQAQIKQLETQKAATAKQLEDQKTAREKAEKTQALLEQRARLAEGALQSATKDSGANAEKIAVLQKEFADAKKLLNKAKIEAEADAEYRKELDDRNKALMDRISLLSKERDSAKSESAAVPGKIADLQKQLDQARKERDGLTAKLQGMQSELTEVSKQRDDALAQVAKLKDAQKQIDKLVADNASLMSKLSEAQNTVAQFKTEGVEKDKQIADLKKEVVSVKLQLEDTKKQNADYQKKMGDLQQRLEDTAKQLAEAKTENTESAAEKKKMQEENQLLRGIVLREQRKEADRQAMKKVVLGELSKLEINSKTLLKQIDFLSEPTVKLTAKERALFKKPELQVSDTEISLAVTKDDAPSAAASPVTPAAPVEAPTPTNSEIFVPDEKPATPKPAPGKGKHASAKATPARSPATPEPAVASTPASTPAPATSEAPQGEDKKPLISLNPDASAPSTAPALELASNTANTSPLFDSKPAPAPAAQTPAAPATTPAPAPAPAPASEAAPSTAPAPANSDAKPADETLQQPLVTPDTAPNTASTPPVPAEFVPLAKQAKEQFERGNYLDAEKAYRKILVKSPRNLYILSNLGVVLFRSGKFKLAEEMFNKAIAVAPEDGFSHCTVGIVYYQEQKLDDAVNELTKALAINPKNPTAHNYLGITASQKGWPEAAEKELLTAVSLDPNYADAYFNLAVVCATQRPPNKEEAKKNYKKAIDLGAEPDPALEQLIK